MNLIRSAVRGESASERRSLSAGDRMPSPNRRAAGKSTVIPQMVGDRMAGRPGTGIRETRRCWWVRRANSPRTWPAGVRASVVAKKRVTTVERRERRKVEVRRTERRNHKPTRVPARANRWWNQPSALRLEDTERLTYALRDEAKSRSLSKEHPLTGEPDAGNLHVRFGGRGGGNTLSLPLSFARFMATIRGNKTVEPAH